MNKLTSMLLGKHATGARPADNRWDDEIPIPPDHPLVPDCVRIDAAPWLEEGCLLHRAQTSTGIEWWLLDQGGGLVEVLLPE